MKRLFCFCLIYSVLYGCAFTDAKLEVQHNTDANFTGPLGGVESLAFNAPQLEDVREDKDRIGWKKNGYGANTADITTVKEVNSIVSDGIVAGLVHNDHTIVDDARVKIEGTVDRFWFDMDVNFWTVEFIGDVQCSLKFIDTLTNESVYESTYSGNYSEKKGGGLNKTWANVMSKALDKLVEDIMFDEDLAEVLDSLSP